MAVQSIRKWVVMDNEEVIRGYIERAILDIARKCNTDNSKVIEIFKKIINK